MVGSINSISGGYRDEMLNHSIGKYNMVKEPMIYAIGEGFDIHNGIKERKTPIMTNGLLDYYNNTKTFVRNGEFEENLDASYLNVRDLNGTTQVEYKKEFVNTYTPDNSYINKFESNGFNVLVDNANAFIQGSSFGLDLNSTGKINFSADFENDNIVSRSIKVAAGTETTLGELGLKSLGLALVNSALINNERKISTLKFLQKPIEFLDAVDKLDTEKLNLPPWLTNGVANVFPIYLYSEVRDKDVVNSVFKPKTIPTWENSETEIGFVKSSSDNTLSITLTNQDFNQQSLLYKTQQLFKGGKIKTLIDSVGGYNEEGDLISKGNALLKKNSLNEFSRVWTAKNQYGRLSTMIRPFDKDKKDILDKDLKRVRPGSDTLKTFGVLEDTGFVKIAPYFKDDFSKEKTNDIKKYMFSIENLAWKDSLDDIIKGTSQHGPNEGRIMWFPPYNMKINESVNVNWNDDAFIGRGEPVFTYTNTNRTGTLGFSLIVDHPSMINYMKQSSSKITDDDYLRFFAGDDVIDLEYKEEEVQEQKTEKKPTPEPIQEITYTFKIYFPNNYTGIDSANPQDAMTYLYKGKDCSDSPVIPNGYEMNLNDEGEGLTSFLASTPCCGNYYYRVDDAYKNSKQSTSGNYKDKLSYGLNSSEDIYDFSFKDVYEYLMIGTETKNIKESFKNVKKIEIDGSASHQGTDETNTKIAVNRAKVVKSWLGDNIGGDRFPNLELKNITSKSIYKSGKDKNNDVNDKDVKKERVVFVRLTTSSETEFNAPDNYKYVSSDKTITTGTTQQPTNTPKRTKVDMYGFSKKDSNSKLWNDEAQFFEKMSEDSVIAEKISEKIKHFQPAFHSTTPEGFNSRLTFLHQCTRQGPTLNFNGSATNMSFGRPPICVLRIGDFFDTKIIINNLNIDYEPIVWDLNQEGIGVQPMIANITMQFNFIGGSDLTGPIARLQNAVTFNFFANTGVYDDRNDRKFTPKDINKPTDEEKNANVLYQPGVYDEKK